MLFTKILIVEMVAGALALMIYKPLGIVITMLLGFTIIVAVLVS
jgi:hypothetical protein